MSREKEKNILRESNPIPSGEESDARPVEPAEQEKKVILSSGEEMQLDSDSWAPFPTGHK